MRGHKLPRVLRSALDLERVLQCELDLPIVSRRVRDGGASRHIHVNQGASSRQTEIRMVEEIEKLRPELDLLRLANLEMLLQNKVEVNQIGATQISDLAVPEAVRGLLSRGQRGRDESRLVDPAIQSLMSRVGAAIVAGLRRCIEREIVGIGNLVRAIVEAARVTQVG